MVTILFYSSSIVINGIRKKVVNYFISVYEKKSKACALTSNVFFFAFKDKWSVI